MRHECNETNKDCEACRTIIAAIDECAQIQQERMLLDYLFESLSKRQQLTKAAGGHNG